MKKQQQIKNELIEKMVESNTFNVYTSKIAKSLKMERDSSRCELMSNLWEALDIFSKRNSLESGYKAIEKYCFQKAYQLTKEQYLTKLGKHRVWIKNEDGERVKVWKQNSFAYDPGMDDRGEYDFYPSDDDSFVYDKSNILDSKAHALDIVDQYYTNSQSVFAKTVLMSGEEIAKEVLDLNDKSFKQRLNRFEKSAENKRRKYIDQVFTKQEKYINEQLELINRVITYIESEKSNEVWLFELLVNCWESSLAHIYWDTFKSQHEIELVVQAFREKKNRKAAYKIVNRLYELKDELEG